MEIAPIWKLAVALAAGVAVGLFYFGGLWLTVRRLSDAKRPHVWALVSFAARTVVAVAAVGLMAWLGGWQTLAACMAGFIAMRLVTARVWGPGGAKPKDGAAPAETGQVAETSAHEGSEA